MKSRILFSIAFLTLFVSCKKETVTTTKVIEKTKQSALEDEYYVYDQKGSKVELQLFHLANSDSVSGTLNFAFAEKDSNHGDIFGKVTNGILIADYVFQSEGKESVRQVAFKFKDDKAILGYGDMTSDGTHFTDVTKVNFDSGVSLTKAD